MEKILTKKQRKEIYLKAAKFFIRKKKIDIGYGCTGFCDFLNRYIDLQEFLNITDFPEYRLFKPRKFNLYWFKHDIEGMNARINALLLAAEMCND